MRDNDYDVRVYRDNEDEAQVTQLQRALHEEICRPGSTNWHAGDVFPACLRAQWVMQRWEHDGRPGAPDPATL